MPLKVLIVPDKFKGTLTASQAARAIALGWRKSRPRDRLDLLPMSDGGDGFGEVIGDLLGAKIQSCATVDAAHRPCQARWWWEPKTKTAVIESAQIIGLARLPAGKFHPFQLDSYGLGAVIRAARAKGAKRCLVGIGGSATNDGGFGMARALGWEFLRRDGTRIEQWTELPRAVSLRAPNLRRWFDELIVAVDVQNPLLGARGATRVYGPQKGLKRSEFARAESCLRKMADTLGAKAKLRRTRGAGAAGGLGFGLLALLGARLESGFELFARLARLEERLRSADLVITGEGSLDESTFMGKGVGEMAQRCWALDVPCFAVAGVIPRNDNVRRKFTQAWCITKTSRGALAKGNPAVALARLAASMARAVDR